ncbi:uncharacterized protein [Primulina huaijiensis]|uniref:uncharacterized protein n=1 Tax=Primulina huaijiensis TaxID=1492673 RepID=UPI003CC77641
MSAITAIALDRLIEPGAAKSMAPARNSPDSQLERQKSTPISRLDRGINAPSSKLERGVSVPPNPKGVEVSSSAKRDRGVYTPYNPKIDKRSFESTTSVADKEHHWTQISPALYATPASTPLPDSPSSFPPSPYIINHKRRGPRLLKSYSEDDVGMCERADHGNGHTAGKNIETAAKDYSFVHGELIDQKSDHNFVSASSGDTVGKCGSNDETNGTNVINGVMKCPSFNLQQDGELDVFVDPKESMSVESNAESEGNGGAESLLNSTAPIAEFYDAWEDLSPEIGPQLPMRNIDNELHETRLNLLIEMEKRKQAEETLNNMRNHWQRICERLIPLGLTLPADPTASADGDQSADPAAEVCQQVYIARFISNSIGRGIAKAEVEMEMEAQIRLKNSEIARLCDRLHYYETVNQEMSQRNQEVVETARRHRQKRKRKQIWVFGSIAAAITLGSAFIGWSYFHTEKGSSSSRSQSHMLEVDCSPK